MVMNPSGRNHNPLEPVLDSDVLGGESQGQIRLFLQGLRNYHHHDTQRWDERQCQNNKTQRDYFRSFDQLTFP